MQQHAVAAARPPPDPTPPPPQPAGALNQNAVDILLAPGDHRVIIWPPSKPKPKPKPKAKAKPKPAVRAADDANEVDTLTKENGSLRTALSEAQKLTHCREEQWEAYKLEVERVHLEQHGDVCGLRLQLGRKEAELEQLRAQVNALVSERAAAAEALSEAAASSSSDAAAADSSKRPREVDEKETSQKKAKYGVHPANGPCAVCKRKRGSGLRQCPEPSCGHFGGNRAETCKYCGLFTSCKVLAKAKA